MSPIDREKAERYTGTHWTNYVRGGLYYVGLVDREHRLIHEHPIPFTDIRESARAVARLNLRDKAVL